MIIEFLIADTCYSVLPPVPNKKNQEIKVPFKSLDVQLSNNFSSLFSHGTRHVQHFASLLTPDSAETEPPPHSTLYSNSATPIFFLAHPRRAQVRPAQFVAFDD
jgi:hypothetical protein